MHLFLDESGSFVPGTLAPEAWCVVAAFVLPEAHRRPAEEALGILKRRLGRAVTEEIKLRDVTDENLYRGFLSSLASGQGTLFACATDTHRNSAPVVARHLEHQVEMLVEHIPRMKFPEARAGLQDRANRFGRLSPQLYLQIVCQYRLLSRILRHAVLYYVQRTPATLGRFRWRVDRKNQMNSVFDESFRDFAAPMLQTMSFTEPQLMLEGADYRHFDRYHYADGPPSYLKDIYGLHVESGYNITMVMREDFEFVDSATNAGVQISDLLASGLRRCLRGGFKDNIGVADALGRLMVQASKGEYPVELLSLEAGEALDRATTADAAIRRMHKTSRSMILHRNGR